MSYYGAVIGGVDTLTQYGLVLGADVTISAAAQRQSRMQIPGRHGSLDGSCALTGTPIYDDRTITFTLLKAATDSELHALRTALAGLCGQDTTLILPDDTAHAWHGVLQLGAHAGYHKGVIPMTMQAYPFKRKLTQTCVETPISAEYAPIILQNEMMPTVPTFFATQDVSLVWNDATYDVAANTTYRNTDIVLQMGMSTLQARSLGADGTLTITYQEGTL